MKLFSLLLLSAALLSACGGRPEQRHTELVKAYFKDFNQHNWKALAARYTESASFRDPSFGNKVVRQSRQQVMAKYQQLGQTIKDVHDEVRRIYPSGEDHVIVEFTSTGTAPDGSKFELPICTIFKIENGLITEDLTYFNDFKE